MITDVQAHARAMWEAEKAMAITPRDWENQKRITKTMWELILRGKLEERMAPTGQRQTRVLPSSSSGWARWCISNGVSLPVYAAGFAMIQGPEGADWLAKGFQAILDESVKAPILAHSNRRKQTYVD